MKTISPPSSCTVGRIFESNSSLIIITVSSSSSWISSGKTKIRKKQSPLVLETVIGFHSTESDFGRADLFPSATEWIGPYWDREERMNRSDYTAADIKVIENASPVVSSFWLIQCLTGLIESKPSRVALRTSSACPPVVLWKPARRIMGSKLHSTFKAYPYRHSAYHRSK